jgi:hypothetical protein
MSFMASSSGAGEEGRTRYSLFYRGGWHVELRDQIKPVDRTGKKSGQDSQQITIRPR